MEANLPNLLAKKFIARTDVKARQFTNGDGYAPDGRRTMVDGELKYVEYYPWIRANLEEHLAGKETYGHYLLNTDNNCKLFAFDIDLEGKGYYPFPCDHTGWNEAGAFIGEISEFKPREDWLNRSHPSRSWLKLQMKTIAHRLAAGIKRDLDLSCAVTYSGHKGVHVYGFLDSLTPARVAREGAKIVMDSAMESWKPSRGDNFYRDTNTDVLEGFQNFQIEIFPKQDELNNDEDGVGFGNLMRLPLGVNRKNPKDPTFFLDMSAAINEFIPADPTWSLTCGNPFKKQGE